MRGLGSRFAREPKRPQASCLVTLRPLRVLVVLHREGGVGF